MFIATFDLEPAAIALADTFDDYPDVKVNAERVAAHGTTWTMPCLWFTGPDLAAVDDALESDDSVDSIVGTTTFVDEKYAQVEWDDGVKERIDGYVDHGGSILNAQASADGWTVRVRFVTREQFDQFREALRARDHSFRLVSLVEPDERRRPRMDLTPAQRDALTAAKRRGYFEVPRGISTRELAAELDMSHQNLSKLLRRATGKLVDKSLETDV